MGSVCTTIGAGSSKLTAQAGCHLSRTRLTARRRTTTMYRGLSNIMRRRLGAVRRDGPNVDSRSANRCSTSRTNAYTLTLDSSTHLMDGVGTSGALRTPRVSHRHPATESSVAAPRGVHAPACLRRGRHGQWPNITIPLSPRELPAQPRPPLSQTGYASSILVTRSARPRSEAQTQT
jgi:hypothetical protein